MEDLLTQISKDAAPAKFANLKKACKEALDFLGDESKASKAPVYLLREKCLSPLQLAMESHNHKLATSAVGGLQKILQDSRFHSPLEEEEEQHWLPMQILRVVASAPNVNEDTQVEVMKILLNMTFSTAWCMNAKVITRITEVCIQVFSGNHISARPAVKATLVQLLSSFAEKLKTIDVKRPEEEAKGAIAEFSMNGQKDTVDHLAHDIVTILKYLCTRLAQSSSSPQARNAVPLILEGIHAILSNVPSSIRQVGEFLDLLWQDLCPTLIVIIGNPKLDKSITSQKTGSQDEVGRGSGCSQTAPALLGPSAKTVYSISVELVRLVGSVGSLRPVLESLFHRILLYPPIQHRLEALKAMKELLNNPEHLISLAGPTEDDDSKIAGKVRKTHSPDTSLIKLVVDSMQESCHCSDSATCITAVSNVDMLLKTVENITQGKVLREQQAAELMERYKKMDQDVMNHTEGSKEMDIQATEVSTTDLQDSEDKSKLSQETMPNADSLPKESYYNLSSKVRVRQCHSDQIERKSAKDYMQYLMKFLPSVKDMCSGHEIDEALLNLASRFCADQQNMQSVDSDNGVSAEVAILNADAVYVSTYTALSFSLKLSQCQYYEYSEKQVPSTLSEEEFKESIIGEGLLLYVSPSWLSELYNQVLQVDLMKLAGAENNSENVFMNLIIDLDGLHSRKLGGQLLTGCSNTTVVDADKHDVSTEAGMLLAQRILTSCWEGTLDVLSVLLTGKSSCGITSSFALMLGTEGAKEETLKAREAICMSLDGLQRAARLACSLGMQSRCGKIFALLAKASCVLEEEQRPSKQSPSTESKPTQANPSKPKPPRLHAAHALSMDLILSMGLEMGSHASDCWKHVFRCCNHIAELEHLYFTRCSQGKPKPTAEVGGSETLGDPDIIPATFTGIPAAICVPSSKSVAEIIKQSGVAAGWDSAMTGGAVLSTSQSTEVLCALSQQVDRLFDDAARKLNMKSLVEYLGALSSSSHSQLFGKNRHLEDVSPSTLLLYRLGDVMLEVLKSDRPLYPVMKAWNRVAPHFVEAACHSEGRIAKKAVTCLHDCVTLRLGSHPELPHLHFNEALCKPFENLLCLDLCDGDVQDQIICSICELVEACASDIKSGWRPLFGALRAVKIEYTVNEEINEARQRHVSAVLDVFEVFLDTDNVWVFAHAAVDCILCLLKYVRGPGEFEDIADSDSDSDIEVGMSVPDAENLVLPALRYLKRCCALLSSMWTMPACPVFSGAHRIQLNPNPQSIDPVIPDMDFKAFQRYFDSLSHKQQVHSPSSTLEQEYERDLDLFTPTKLRDTQEQCTASTQTELVKPSKGEEVVKSTDTEIETDKKDGDQCKGEGEGDYVCNKELELVNDSDSSSGYSLPHGQPHKPCPNSDSEPDEEPVRYPNVTHSIPSPSMDYIPVALETMDNHTGLLHVWFLVLEGLTNAVSACPKNYQPQTLETLFDLLRDASKTPGCEFSTHCVNHLLLPMLQGWLRKGGQYRSFWETTATNFKQCCGLCTDLVVELIVQFTASPETTPSLEFLLKQMLDVLIECISQSVETISRLGCACTRHILLSGGPLFTEPMWHIATTSLLRAFDVTMYSLKQLMVLFEASSDNFYGDIGQVKVAARKDSTPAQCERLRQLARQVFLLDSQQACLSTQSAVDDDKSYVFLLYPPGCENSLNPEHIAMRVPLRNVVLSLLSHQLLLQTVGYVLLQGTHIYTQSECQLLPGLNADTDSQGPHKLPGMLQKLSTRNVLVLFKCLDESYRFACDFNSRPGLKFLIQKVINSSVASNLYKSAGASMTFCVHALLEICLHQENLTLEKIATELQNRGHLEFEQCNNESSENAGAGNEKLEPSKHEDEYDSYNNATEPIDNHFDLFTRKLHQSFAGICQKYIELVLDKEGTSSADRISDRPLFFLVSQVEELPSLKREKALSEIVAEKLKQREQKDVGGFMTTAVAQIQDSHENSAEAEKEAVEQDGRPDVDKDLDKVYQVATDVTIQSVISTYKKRKQQKTLPNFVKFTKEKDKKKKKQSKDGLDPEIEKQQHVSVMKDAEAHKESWTEMICTVLYLLLQLPDQDFHALLPVVFSWINQLICHVENQRLKDAIAKWLHKVGHMNGWSGHDAK